MSNAIEKSVNSVSSAKNNSSKNESFFRINKKLLPFKLHFFLFIGGMGAVLPYSSAVGINRYRFTASNISASFAAQQFLFIILKPFIGYLTDYFNKVKSFIIGLTVLQAMFFLFMIIIPKVEIQNKKIILGINRSIVSQCHLCDIHTEFEEVALNLSVKTSTERLCDDSSAIMAHEYRIQCHESQLNSTYSRYPQFHVIHTICNVSSNQNSISLLNSTITSNLHTNEMVISHSYNLSKLARIYCLFEDSELRMFNFTIGFMKEHCRVFHVELIFTETLIHTPNMINTTIKCSSYEANYAVSRNNDYNALLSTEIFKTYQYWLFTAFIILACLCASSIFTLSDTACYESLQGTGGDYGKQRAWGAIAWGIIAPFAGYLNDYTDSYIASWFLMVCICSLQIWNLSKMTLIKPDLSQSVLKDLKSIFSSLEFVLFLTGVFINGMCTGIIWFYLTWFITVIDGNKLQIGLAHTMECFLGEVPFMFFSGWIIKKLGHFNIVSLAIFTHAVRFLLYSYLHNPWWILPIEASHGLTFGTFYSAMTSFGKLNSKPGTEATTQSVLCTTYEGLGAGLGCLLTGYFFDRYGAHTTFFYLSFIGAFSTVLNIVFTFIANWKKGDQNITVAAEANRY